MQNKLKFAGYLTISIILTLGLSISMQSLLAAWTAPTQNPPGGNPDKPIDESAVGQTKLGNLSVGGNFYVGDGGTNDVLFVDNANGKVGIGTTTPGYNLDVLGSARITGDLHGINYIYGDFGTIARSTDEWLRLNDGSTHTSGVHIPNNLRVNGNVGIGGNPGASKLYVTGGNAWINGGYLYVMYPKVNGIALAVENKMLSGHGVSILSGWNADAPFSTMGLAVSRSLTTGGTQPTHILFNDGNTYHKGLAVNGPVYSSGGYLTNTNPSSKNYKTNIKPLELETGKILDLELKSFTWKDNDMEDFGYIAEEVKEILPGLYRDDGHIAGYQRDKLIFYVIELIKSQQEQIGNLEEDNKEMKNFLCERYSYENFCD